MKRGICSSQSDKEHVVELRQNLNALVQPLLLEKSILPLMIAFMSSPLPLAKKKNHYYPDRSSPQRSSNWIISYVRQYMLIKPYAYQGCHELLSTN